MVGGKSLIFCVTFGWMPRNVAASGASKPSNLQLQCRHLPCFLPSYALDLFYREQQRISSSHLDSSVAPSCAFEGSCRYFLCECTQLAVQILWQGECKVDNVLIMF